MTCWLLSLPQYPGRTFQATFDTTANAFNPQTRTVVTELLVKNPDHLIWPGTYADVHFVMPSDPNVLIGVLVFVVLVQYLAVQRTAVRTDDLNRLTG